MSCKMTVSYTHLDVYKRQDGLIIEVHNDPEKALCDGAQSLTPEQFDQVMEDVRRTTAFFGKIID